MTTSPDKVFKVIVVGTGYFSHFQIEAWQRISDVCVVAVCDVDLTKAQGVAQQYGIEKVYAHTELAILNEKPDILDIVTPPSTHFALCQLAVNHGVHLVCQKPIAPTFAESTQLVRMVEQYPIRFMVHENFRWQPWYREIKRLIDEDMVGEVFSLNFIMRMGDGWGADAYLSRQPFFRDYKRLLIFETGVHFIDTFRYLLGEITSVYTRHRQLNPVIKGEDSALCVFGFANGATAILDANRFNESNAKNPRYTFGILRLDGSKGHLELNSDGEIHIKLLGQPLVHHPFSPPLSGFAGDCVFATQKHFVQCLKSGQDFETNGVDYLRTLKIVEACYASAQSGEVIQIDHYVPGSILV
jgi:predicted dehydrogenase